MADQTSNIFKGLVFFAVLSQGRRTNKQNSPAAHGKMDGPGEALRSRRPSSMARERDIISIDGRLAVVIRDERPAYPFVTVRWMGGQDVGKENEVIKMNFLDKAAAASLSSQHLLDPGKHVRVTVTNNKTDFEAALNKTSLGAKDFLGRSRFEQVKGVSGRVAAILWSKGIVWLTGWAVCGWVPINALLGFEKVTWKAGEEALSAGFRSDDKAIRTGPFNMDVPHNARKGLLMDNLDACKRRCVEDAQCLAIKYSSHSVYYEDKSVNCLICYTQGDTEFDPDSAFQTWTKIPPKAAYKEASPPCGDADIKDISEAMQEPGTISDCSVAVNSDSECNSKVFWTSYLHRVCKCVKSEKDCKAEAPKNETGEHGFLYVWNEVEGRYSFQAKGEYKFPHSSKALLWLNEDLTEVSSKMRQNIHEPWHRRDNLDTTSDKDTVLLGKSKTFKDTARELSQMFVVQKNVVHSVIGLSVLVAIWVLWRGGFAQT